MRTIPVSDGAELSRTVDEHIRFGYDIETQGERRAVIYRQDRGSMLTHLALFFTIGLMTLGVANLWYARYRRKKSSDRIEIIVENDCEEHRSIDGDELDDALTWMGDDADE